MSDQHNTMTGGGRNKTRRSRKSSPKRRRSSAGKTRKRTNNNLGKTVYPNAALKAVLGKSKVTYTESTKLIWSYIKRHKLNNGVWITIDAKLKKLFNSGAKKKLGGTVKRGKPDDKGAKKYTSRRVHMTGLPTLVHANLSKTPPRGVRGGGEASDGSDSDSEPAITIVGGGSEISATAAAAPSPRTMSVSPSSPATAPSMVAASVAPTPAQVL